VKAVLLTLVMAGAWLTVRVNCCGGLVVPAELLAVMVKGYVPPAPGAGVPVRVAVPLPLSLKVTPAGSVPDSDRVGAGNPVVVTWKDPGGGAVPTVNVVWSELVIDGAVVAGLTTVKVTVPDVLSFARAVRVMFWMPLLSLG
jgi:hypothetical protein